MNALSESCIINPLQSDCFIIFHHRLSRYPVQQESKSTHNNIHSIAAEKLHAQKN